MILRMGNPLVPRLALLTGILFAASIITPAQRPQAEPTVTATPADATSAPAVPSAAAAATVKPALTSPPAPKVIEIEGRLELDNVVRVKVENLAEWAATNDATKLVPFLNGRAIRGNYPEEIHASQNHLLFDLRITRENKEIWTDLLGEPAAASRPVTFSVGPEGDTPFVSNYDQSNRVMLTVISPFYGVVALIVVLATLVLFISLARKTSIIRQPGPKPGGGKLKPYNLGRAQMAFWFFLVYASYMAIWIVTDALDTITPSLLGLMGISAGTALSEALIDSGKDSAKSSQAQALTAEQQSLQQDIPQLQAKIANIDALATPTPPDLTNRDNLNAQLQSKLTRLAQVNQTLQTLTDGNSANISQGFLRDVLSDGDGYSFHRFQIFAWTIVLGIIFISSVYNNLTMPEFSATLLGLMGLSSGTYIGFKFPEQK